VIEEKITLALLGDMTRRLLIIVCIAGTIVASVLFVWSRQHSEHPQFRLQTPDSIEVFVGKEQIGTVTNTLDLIALLRTGKWEPPHACVARCEFIIRYSTGESVRVAFYPGHSDSEYEFAVNGNGYSFARQSLMSVLTAAGIDVRKIPQ